MPRLLPFSHLNLHGGPKRKLRHRSPSSEGTLIRNVMVTTSRPVGGTVRVDSCLPNRAQRVSPRGGYGASDWRTHSDQRESQHSSSNTDHGVMRQRIGLLWESPGSHRSLGPGAQPGSAYGH